jgi:hypothetical protein
MNPEQEKEFQVRANLFKEEFEPLLKKYELELTAFPLYAAAPGGAFVTVLTKTIYGRNNCRRNGFCVRILFWCELYKKQHHTP